VGTGLSSGTGVAIGATGTLTIAWTAPGSGAPRLLAGNYSDTITIIIEARP
jgi:spore coat protein U-like protein